MNANSSFSTVLGKQDGQKIEKMNTIFLKENGSTTWKAPRERERESKNGYFSHKANLSVTGKKNCCQRKKLQKEVPVSFADFKLY